MSAMAEERGRECQRVTADELPGFPIGEDGPFGCANVLCWPSPRKITTAPTGMTGRAPMPEYATTRLRLAGDGAKFDEVVIV